MTFLIIIVLCLLAFFLIDPLIDWIFNRIRKSSNNITHTKIFRDSVDNSEAASVVENSKNF